MPNQTLIQIPLDLSQEDRLKRFLTQLIVKLDTVLGYRGGDPYITKSALNAANANLTGEINSADLTLLGLANSLQELINIVADNSETIADNSARIGQLQEATAVSKLSYAAPTIDAVYSQAQMQSVANAIQNASNKIDEILDVLIAAEITS